MNMTYGVLRQQDYLETLLQKFCRQPLSKLKPFVRYTLLIGLYQIMFLDRIPDSAAVNEAVKAVQAAKLPKQLQGLVNGILRNAARQQGQLPQPDAADSHGQPFLNHPPWLTQRWSQHFGQHTMEDICRANNQQQPLVLQVNSSRCSRDQLRDLLQKAGTAVHHGTHSPEALILTDFNGRIENLPGFHEGYFQVQGEAPQLATGLLAPIIPDGRYLDACAGLGGKTSQLLGACLQMNSAQATAATQLQAVEPEARRRGKFLTNLKRLHPDQSITPYPGTLQDFAQHCTETFDGILIDAPCSGTGVTGRHPDIRWNRLETDFKRYQSIQLDILRQAATILNPRGIIVYATCSLEPEENQEVIELFLTEHPDFRLSECAPLLPPAARILTQGPFFAPTPAQGIDGFFAARLLRDPD